MSNPPLTPAMISASLTLFHLLDLNVLLLDEEGKIRLAHERAPLPVFVLEDEEAALARLLQACGRQPGAVHTCANAWGLHYMGRAFQDADGSTWTWIAGPYSAGIPALEPDHRGLREEPSRRGVWQPFARGLKVLSRAGVQSMANALDRADVLRQAPIQALPEEKAPARPERRQRPPASPAAAEEGTAAFHEQRYRLEKALQQAIAAGDPERLRQLAEESYNWFDFSERFPGRPIRGMKNMLVVLNTLSRLGAEQGGVHPHYLHQLSEYYAVQIERADSLAALERLSKRLGADYCELVRQRGLERYSPSVQRAVRYMSVHYGKPLQLGEVARHAQVHPAHLSRQFKQETGLTWTEYANRLRIGEAKRLLRPPGGERPSIDRVAGEVGFEDAAYFARVFKRLEGMTPTAYRLGRDT